MISDKLRAWVWAVNEEGYRVMAAFTAISSETGSPSCPRPAHRTFHSTEDARHWVEHEAATFSVDIEWADGQPAPLRDGAESS